LRTAGPVGRVGPVPPRRRPRRCRGLSRTNLQFSFLF
jgi:hypothetical protein